MIYCPKCGTANRRGSRFCNECGEPLPMRTALRCPLCGTMNPVSNTYCDRCQARLLPLAAPAYAEPEPEPAAPPAEEVAERVAPEEQEAEDWLAQLRAPAEEGAEEPEGAGKPAEPAEIPAWLRDIGPIAVEPQPAPGDRPFTEPPTEEAGWPQEPTPADVPDWLREVAPPGAAAVPEAEPEKSLPVEFPPIPAEVPDWLREMAPPEAVAVPEAEPEKSLPVEFPPIPAEVADWLREIAPPAAAVVTEAEPEEAVPVTPPPVSAEMFDWLQEIAPPAAAVAPEAEPEEATPVEFPPVPAEVPDWLREMAPPEAAAVAPEAEPEQAIPVEFPPVPAEVPDWLREMAPPEAAPPETVPPVPQRVEVPPEAKSTKVPEWLAALMARPTEPSAPTAPGLEGIFAPSPTKPGTGVTEMEGLARAEIPAWLKALRPRTEPAEKLVETEPMEAEGLLAGLSGVLPPTLAIQTPATREGARPSETSQASLARAQLLQGLLAQPTEAAQPSAGQRGWVQRGWVHPGIRSAARTAVRLQRWLVLVVLLVAVGSTLIAPLIIPPGGGLPTLTQPARSPAADNRMDFQRVTSMHSAIQGLSAESTVLVAFEYGPAEADELNPVAEPILRHLLDQRARISIVSTRPEGQSTAAGLLNRITAAEGEYTAGQVTLAGYRTSEAMGVAQLLRATETRPALVLVLTAQPGPLRWWVEQTRALYGDALPVVAGMSAALEPAASPYLESNARQLEGAINGLSGAAAYEALRQSAGQATQRLNALAAGHVVIVGLMILGAVFYTFSGARVGGPPSSPQGRGK